jgi:hypothetical protein
MFPSFEEEEKWNSLTFPSNSSSSTYEFEPIFPSFENNLLTLEQPIYRGIAIEQLSIPTSQPSYWTPQIQYTKNEIQPVYEHMKIVPVPEYVERYSSFYSNATPNVIITELKRVFDEQLIDYEIDEEQAKVRIDMNTNVD